MDDFLKEVDKLPREEARLDRLRNAIKVHFLTSGSESKVQSVAIISLTPQNHPEEPSLMLALTKQ